MNTRTRTQPADDIEMMELIIEAFRPLITELSQQSSRPHLAEELPDDSDGDLAFARIDQFYI